MKQTTKIAVIVFLCVMGIIPTVMVDPVIAQSQESGLGFEFSSDIVTKTFSMYKEYNNETFSYLYNGVSFYETYCENDAFWGDDGYYHVLEEHIDSKTIHLNHQYNTTVSGYFKTEMTLDMYEVKITYGDIYEMSFYALKNGSFYTEYYQNYLKDSHYRFNVDYTTRTFVEKIYLNESRQTLLSEEVINVEEDQVWGGSPTPGVSIDDSELYYNQTASFAAPLVMINQMFVTPSGQKVAWGELMWEMIMFSDFNDDGYYSADSNFYEDPEYEGRIQPYFLDSYVYYEVESRKLWEIEQSFPNDTHVSDAASYIDFNKPSVSNGILSWGIEYLEFPFHTNATSYLFLPEIPYADALKADYSFDFQFFLNGDDTQLDITSGFSLVGDSQARFSAEREGMSLSTPRYSYLLSSMKIDQQFSDAMTRQTQVFEFEAEEEGKVCEIDMSGTKEPYTLYNHSDNNAVSIHNSIGAGVSKVITAPMQSAITPATVGRGRYFAQMTFLPNLVFSVDDLVQDEPLLRKGSNASRLLSIETENYPVWSGNSFYHDPSLKIDLAPQFPLLEIGIGIAIICGVFGISVVAIFYYRSKK